MADGFQVGNWIKIQALHVGDNPEITFLINKLTFKNVIGSTWSAEPAYGKMDDIPFYGNTKRSVSLSFNTYVDEKSKYTAVKMQQAVADLIKFQYPRYSYARKGDARVISSPPFFRITHYTRDKLGSYFQYEPITGYVVGNLTIDPASEAGFSGGQALPVIYNAPGGQSNEIYEQGFSISMNVTVVHEEPPGWVEDKWIGYNKVFFSDTGVDFDGFEAEDLGDPEDEVKAPSSVASGATTGAGVLVQGAPPVGGNSSQGTE